MDVETLRLEREEKRRQRRERIRKILEDDDYTPTTRQTREDREAGSPRTTRSTANTRRPRENIAISTTSEGSSTRSTSRTTGRLRDNITSSNSDDTSARSNARRLREDRTTPSERTHTRSSNTSAGSPTRSTRTTRSTRQATETTDEPAADSIRVRREARRKRNQEHDNKQNKITVENGEVNKGGHSRIIRGNKGTGNTEVHLDEQEAPGEPKYSEKTTARNTEDKLGKSQKKEDTNDVVEENEKTAKDSLESGNQLTVIEKQDEHTIVEKHDVADKESVMIVKLKTSEAASDESSSQIKHEKETQPELECVENDGIDLSITVTKDDKQDDGEKDTDEIKQSDKKEVKRIDGTVEKKCEEVEESHEDKGTRESELSESSNTKEASEISVIPIAEERPISEEPEPETKAVEQLFETSPLQSATTESSSTTEIADADDGVADNGVADNGSTDTGHADNGSADKEKSAFDEKLVILEELAEVPVVLEINPDVSSVQTDPSENEATKESAKTTSEKVSTQSIEDGIPQGSVKELDDISPAVTKQEKTVTPEATKTSPRKGKFGTKSDEVDTKSTKTRTKSDVSRTKSDEFKAKNDRLEAKTDTTRTKSAENEATKESAKTTSEEVSTQLESTVDGTPQGLVKEPDDISPVVTKQEKTVTPEATKTSPRKGKFGTKSDEADTKSNKTRTKSDVSRTKSDESEAKNDRLKTKTDVTRTKSAESGAKANEVGPKTSRVGKLKVGDDFWKKKERKKRIPDMDRAVELTVLGRTGRIQNKLKSCETRDVENAEQWKKEVKKGPRKHRSFDEETEKELREMSSYSSKLELKNIVQSCEEKDKESADAWKREVKKNARKHKSLDEDTEAELREISKTSLLKSRVKECEEKDKESVEVWNKEVKKGDRPKDADAEAEVSEDLKEFSGRGRLKELISSCAERDENREKSWESAKEKQKLKAADNEEELEELKKMSEAKTKLIKQYEEMDKESAESGKKKMQSGEGEKSFDETTDEELKELAKTVDVKTRIQSRVVEQEKPKEVTRTVELEDEELKEINLKATIEAFKESEKQALENKGKKSPSKASSKPDSGKVSPSKAGIGGRKSPSKDIAQRGRTSPTKGDSGRISPAKDRPRSSSAASGRVSPSKARTSSAIGDSSGRTSPSKDKARASSTIGDSSGRVSPAKDRTKTKGDSGRTSPSKRDTSGGKISPSKDGTPATKLDTKGRTSPTKDSNVPAKSKLESIRAKLNDGSKNKTTNRREISGTGSKPTSIKDKIAACKERDKAAPRTISLPKTTSKTKLKPEPDDNTLNAGPENAEADESGEKLVPVNRAGEQFMTIEDEAAEVDVDIKGKMTYWESPKLDEDVTAGRDSPPKDSERPAPVILGNIKQGWQKRKRKLNAAEFMKELLSSHCKRRDLKDIQDIKSETKKYLAGGMHAEETRADSEKTLEDEEKSVKKNVVLEIDNNSRKNVGKTGDKKDDDEFSFDDVVNPDEVKQLRGFSNFRRQVRPTNRRAAKSNPVRTLQQRDDLKTGTETFNDVDDEDEEDAPLKPTAIGRLGRVIEPGDRKSRDSKQFDADALAALAAKEDVSKITLKKTSKSRTGVSQEKSEHDGTAPVMLMQIKGHRHMQTRLVEPSVESLNSSDCFIMVTEKYLHVWNGKDANVMKKSKASEISNKILQYKLLNCSASVVTIIKDGGVNVDTGLTRTFWNTLGGRKTVKGSKEIPKDGDYEKAVVSSNVVYAVDTSTEPAKLHKMSELCGKIPKIDMLDSNKAFVFDFGSEVYTWLGRTCDKATRTTAVNLGQDVHKAPFEAQNSLNPITPNIPKDDDKPRQLKRPPWALFGRMTERAETILFEQKFADWPDVSIKMKMDKEKDSLNKNLSKGYAKRMAKIEKQSEFQVVELVPYDGAKMGEEPAPVKLILEGVNVGRGRGSFDEIERRSLSVTTNSVTVYHSSDKESRQLEEKEWGHFYSAESYVIRWSYSVKASGIRSLKGGESKRDTTGRDQIAYFFWHGRDCSASGKGTSALATIELDSDKSPQIMVDEGHESACFLNMFDGQMIVHHGKPDEAKSIEDDNVLMYCVHHEDEREICLTQVEARSSNLRSRSSFVVVVIDQAVGVCVWHGAKTTKEKKEGALRGAKKLATWFQSMFDISKVDMVELDEGHEGNLFWEALDGKNDYGSLKNASGKCDNRVRLFNFLSTEGPFLAREILNPTRGEHVAPYPFRQANLYDATQPALFLVDAVHEMYLWQGWWPGNPEESESATTTGSAEFRWHRDRKLAMQSIQSYADTIGRQMSKAYVVNAGLEPIEFRALFPFWEDQPDVAKINLESGKVDGKKESMTELLTKLSRDRYTLAELLVRPLPEGVDPLKMEMYLSDEEFQGVFDTTKDEFTKLPKWKKLEQRKKVGLF